MSKASGPPQDKPPSTEEGSAQRAPLEKTSGRITYDDKGNASWEWQMKTGVFGRDIDTSRLKKLTPSDLKIEEDRAPAAGGGQKDAPGAGKPGAAKKVEARPFGYTVKPGGGFDPYNSQTPAKSTIPDPKAIPTVTKTRIITPPPKRSLWARLADWAMGRHPDD